MPANLMERLVADLRTRSADTPAGDAALLDAYLAKRDDTAFAALVERHGPMVLGVCRRILGHAHDAEDAFQAVFWVLARKARTVRPRAWVGNWLYGVAVRTALKARGLRQRRREKQVDAMPPAMPRPTDADRDVLALLDEEIERLPAKYRLAVVGCELEGRSRKEAATQLGVAEGTLSSRLAYARRLLARRLTARGVTLGAGGVAAVVAERGALAAVPQSLLLTTVAAAGATAPTSGAVAALAQGVLTAMFFSKLKKTAAALVLGVAALGLGWGVRSLAAGDDTQAGAGPAAGQQAPAQPAPKADGAAAKAGKPAAPSILGAWRLLRIDIDDGTAEHLDDLDNKSVVRITPTQAIYARTGSVSTHPIKLGPGTIDWVWQDDEAKSATPCIYTLDEQRLRIHFGKDGKRPQSPKDAEQSWTLVRQPSRQDAYRRLDDLQGHWHAVAGEYNGDAFLPRELETVTLMIQGDGWQMTPPTETAQPDFVPRSLFGKRLSFVLETAGPRHYLVMELKTKPPSTLAVLQELRGDELRLCWDAQAQPWDNTNPRPKNTPTQFKSDPGSGFAMFTFKRPKPTPPPAPEPPPGNLPPPQLPTQLPELPSQKPAAGAPTTLPAEMTILAPAGVEVRSGPTMEYYPTSRLRYGDKVTVLRVSESQKDWYAIKPPPGSFSWVSGKHIKRIDERTGFVTTENNAVVPILPGSSLVNKQPNVESTKLASGTLVTLLDRPLEWGGQSWQPIQPPPTEVRFIPKDAVLALQTATVAAPNWTRLPDPDPAPRVGDPSGRPAFKIQVRITSPDAMKVRLFEGKEDKPAPARFTFEKPGVYRFKVSSIAPRPGKHYYPTLEIPTIASAHALAFLANSYVPIELTDDEFGQADQGGVITRYFHVKGVDLAPDEPDAERVQVSRLRPEANDQTVVIAILRIGGIDLDAEPD